MWPGITTASLVCLRFDDYHQDTDHKKWVDVLSRYNNRGLRGIIGVIPRYQDERLNEEVVGFLHGLQADGWEIAQHGYTHQDIGTGRGGILYDERSEFAGIPLEEQRRRIGSGRDILESHGLHPTTFIPPWHEYDRNTVRALTKEGFNCVNEGRWPVPRTIENVTLVPTHIPGIPPNKVGAGVVTLVSHPHLTDTPMSNAATVMGYEDRLRTPNEIVDWWTNQSKLGHIVDAAEPLYRLYSV